MSCSGREALNIDHQRRLIVMCRQDCCLSQGLMAQFFQQFVTRERLDVWGVKTAMAMTFEFAQLRQ